MFQTFHLLVSNRHTGIQVNITEMSKSVKENGPIAYLTLSMNRTQIGVPLLIIFLQQSRHKSYVLF